MTNQMDTFYFSKKIYLWGEGEEERERENEGTSGRGKGRGREDLKQTPC